MMPDAPSGWPDVPSNWPAAPSDAPDAPPSPNSNARTKTWAAGPLDIGAWDVQTAILTFDVPGDFPAQAASAQAKKVPTVRVQNHDDWSFWE
jgi:hypothetical protein